MHGRTRRFVPLRLKVFALAILVVATAAGVRADGPAATGAAPDELPLLRPAHILEGASLLRDVFPDDNASVIYGIDAASIGASVVVLTRRGSEPGVRIAVLSAGAGAVERVTPLFEGRWEPDIFAVDDGASVLCARRGDRTRESRLVHIDLRTERIVREFRPSDQNLRFRYIAGASADGDTIWGAWTSVDGRLWLCAHDLAEGGTEVIFESTRDAESCEIGGVSHPAEDLHYVVTKLDGETRIARSARSGIHWTYRGRLGLELHTPSGPDRWSRIDGHIPRADSRETSLVLTPDPPTLFFFANETQRISTLRFQDDEVTAWPRWPADERIVSVAPSFAPSRDGRWLAVDLNAFDTDHENPTDFVTRRRLYFFDAQAGVPRAALEYGPDQAPGENPIHLRRLVTAPDGRFVAALLDTREVDPPYTRTQSLLVFDTREIVDQQE
ncbi:MAG: hypothetical protein ACF8PN_05120 [Phycisphaerales bacterium]